MIYICTGGRVFIMVELTINPDKFRDLFLQGDREHPLLSTLDIAKSCSASVEILCRSGYGSFEYLKDNPPPSSHGWETVEDFWLGTVPVAGDYRAPVFNQLPHLLTLKVRCRKCPSCLRLKAAEWAYRAAHEMRRSPRTWLCSFTYTPHHHFYCGLRASEQGKTRDWQVARDVALFFKRVRTNFKQPIAHMYVLEKHKSGLPHAHALIHERSLRGLRKVELHSAWNYGFSSFKLVEQPMDGDPIQHYRRVSRYVVKYLQKQHDARVRASLHYGRPSAIAKR